ncbi:Cytochrome P450 94C1 [Neolecta irregularis DAH-3]|uniref:Cytochrome P450 94C1 n=1 Tax=Neolecta irregularis (strain DAH-3) TaxID=1198029 RepID=A0A1U7LSD9_NEOID|nr:Cytochrome P450 94C1 [Neolecta irregularis DAH-3]|eukprot:OLL25577.1 Cytochrome P450 94C1 [Neolecta irregularis DAH-3]
MTILYRNRRPTIQTTAPYKNVQERVEMIFNNTSLLIVSLHRFLDIWLPPLITKNPRQNPQAMIVVAVILALVAFVWYRYPQNAIGTRPRPDLKGPQGYPLIGNLFEVLGQGHRILENLLNDWQTYGPGCSITIPFGGRLISVNTPEQLAHILKSNFDNYVKGRFIHEISHEVLGHGIFNADGEKWRYQRKVASHIFTASAFKGLISDVINDEIANLLLILKSYSESGEAFNISDLFFRMTLDIFAKISVSQEFHCLTSYKSSDHPALARAIEEAAYTSDLRTRNPFWKITELLTGKNKDIKKWVTDINTWAYGIIAKRRKQLDDCKEERKDLLSLFMAYRDENDRPLSDEELRDIIFNFILAGRDTTAQASTWLIHHILKNPETITPLHEEISRLPTPTYESQGAHVYVNALILESLRLEPVLPKSVKTAIHDDILPGGVLVQAGDKICYSAYVMGRLAEIWGEDVLRFRPERWIDSEGKLKRESAFKYPVFNAGPRICLGQAFATFELVVFISRIFEAFDVKRAVDVQKEEDVRYAESLTHPMVGGLWVRVVSRKVYVADFILDLIFTIILRNHCIHVYPIVHMALISTHLLLLPRSGTLTQVAIYSPVKVDQEQVLNLAKLVLAQAILPKSFQICTGSKSYLFTRMEWSWQLRGHEVQYEEIKIECENWKWKIHVKDTSY